MYTNATQPTPKDRRNCRTTKRQQTNTILKSKTQQQRTGREMRGQVTHQKHPILRRRQAGARSVVFLCAQKLFDTILSDKN